MHAQSTAAFVGPQLTSTDLLAVVRLVHSLAHRLALRAGRPHLEDDLAQLGLETTWRLAHDYDRTRSLFTTFVYRRARGAMLDALDRDLHTAGDADSERIDLTPCDVPSPEDQLHAARENARQLALAQAGLARLDPIDRRLVERCVMHDQRIVEISAELGVDYEWARWRLKRAIATLKGACA